MTEDVAARSPWPHIENLQIQSESLLKMVISLHRAITAVAQALPEDVQAQVVTHQREVLQEMHVLQSRLEDLAGRLGARPDDATG